MNELIDYTTATKHPHCPKCGRRGEVTEYINGMRLFIHKKRLEGFAWNCYDSCIIPSTMGNKERLGRERLLSRFEYEYGRANKRNYRVIAFRDVQQMTVRRLFNALVKRGYVWSEVSGWQRK